MKKLFMIVILSAVVLGVATSATGGTFFFTLDSVYCGSLSPRETRIGCNGYLQYRIQHGLDRNKANRDCPWGCSQVYKSRPGKIPACQTGCAKANAADKR